MSRIAVIALKEEDFGLESNPLFSNHGPRVPKALFSTRPGGGFCRAKIAVSFMDNVNDAIKNLRLNQHLDSPDAVGYINFKSKKERCFSLVHDFEEVRQEIKRWSDACSEPFTAVIWVEAMCATVSRSKRRLVPTRPLLLQPAPFPFFRPGVDVTSKAGKQAAANGKDANDGKKGNSKVSSSSSLTPQSPIVLSTSNPGGDGHLRRGGGGGGGGGGGPMRAMLALQQKENKHPWTRPSTSARALAKNKGRAAPGCIYRSRISTPAPNAYATPGVNAPDPVWNRNRPRATISGRNGLSFTEQAIRQSIGPGPCAVTSSFRTQRVSRPATRTGHSSRHAIVSSSLQGYAFSDGDGAAGRGSNRARTAEPHSRRERVLRGQLSGGGGGTTATTAGGMTVARPSNASGWQQRPSTVGNTSPRVFFGRAQRFIRPAKHSGVTVKPVIKDDVYCQIRSSTPGPRYFLGGANVLGQGKHVRGGRQSCSQQWGAPSAVFSTSPRW